MIRVFPGSCLIFIAKKFTYLRSKKDDASNEMKLLPCPDFLKSMLLCAVLATGRFRKEAEKK